MAEVAVLLVRVAAARFDALVDVSEADWRKCHPCRGVADRRAKGVRIQCRRSLTLVEDSLNPVEEIVSVPGVHAVPPLVKPTGGP